jgi:hypothetical protein
MSFDTYVAPWQGWEPLQLWELRGSVIRKDGTLGSNPESVGFGVARIERRKLDGTWEALVPRKLASRES